MVLNVTGVFSLILCVANAYFFHPMFLEHPTYLNPPSMERPSALPHSTWQRETSHVDALNRDGSNDNRGQTYQRDKDAEVPDWSEVPFHPLRGSSADYVPGVAFSSSGKPLLQENVQPGVYYAPFHRLNGRDACSLDVFAELDEIPELFAMTLLIVGN
ncbi:unnamed protein product [Cyprideis torosa]|uniref:Uncharacterized protein n=1 Tax=Cyprideis torosa TaxID=163714 RepID=A0A7R8ZQL4_9CRUS|nr:unnamed protein product [Cyprideis torosa]CAG0903192.1 unnamed protein product [Cyprideis torosa]